PELKTFHPTDVLVTGFDIIFFWVARMMMMTMHFMKNEDGTPQIPFKTVYVHGLVRDAEGQKMSKSKGNVLDPLDLIDGIDLESLVAKRTTGLMKPQDAPKIEKATRKEFPEGINAFGTDALRFTFAALASTGRDIKFDMKRVEGYRNFCNKLWNAARFVLGNCEGQDVAVDHTNYELSVADHWIISRLQRTEQAVADAFAQYRFDQAAQAIYEFAWNEYCDWYLELTKPVLTGDAPPAAKAGTRRTLVRVLETLLRLLHPIMPFITEEIWQRVKPLVGKTADSIMLEAYPVADESKVNVEAEQDVAWLQAVISAIRNIRGELNISPAKALTVLFHHGGPADQVRLERYRSQLAFLARLETLTWLEAGAELPFAATKLVGDMSLLVPLKGLIDAEAEAARLRKELDKLEKEVGRLAGKLENPAFVDKAPADVVAKEQEKLAAVKAEIATLQEQLVKVEAL
ncbi:MAG TPA: class I tRNA ligase family protein, partial [Fluviicoccus sp.]|nr:class I tRNA ligase family protein [Fluviicoccus sp.]